MKELLIKNKSFRYYFICNSISKIGDFVDDIAFAQLAYLITQSTMFMSFIFIIKLVLSFLTIFSSAFLERINKRIFVCACEFFQAFNLLVLVFLCATGNVTPLIIVAFTVLQAIFSTSSAPVKDSILPIVVPKEEIQKSRALTMSTEKVIEILSYLLSATIIVSVGYKIAFLIDGITFVITTILYWHIELEAAVIDDPEKPFNRTDILGGLSFVKTKRTIFAVMLFTSLCNFILCPFDSMLPVYFSQNQYKEYVYSLYMGVYALGGVIGSGIMMKHKVNNAKVVLIINYFIASVSLSLLFFNTTISTFISAIVLGISVTCITCINMNIIQINTPDRLMTRVMGLFRFICVAFGPIGVLLIGILGEMFEIKLMYLCLGIMFGMIALLSIMLLESTAGYEIHDRKGIN